MSGHGINFKLNPELYLKDPQMTVYGQKLLKHSVILLDELGFEAFTFKKLAKAIDSTEASIYRYFVNKHVLLLWLTSWYWEWVNYLMELNLMNIKDPVERLKIVIHNIVNASTESPLTEYINENVLHKVIIKDGAKAYHIHNVDDENQHGYFESYKVLVNKIASIISEAAPDFKYPRMLASNMFEMSNNQIYFAEHLPALTEIKNRKDKYVELEKAVNHMVFKIIS